MKIVFPVLLLCGIFSARLAAADLSPVATQPFDSYVSSFETQRLTLKPFIRANENEERHARLLKGDIVVFPASGNGEKEVKGGLIHDWIGAMFIPYATIPQVLKVVQDYPRQKVIYAPEIADSKLKSHQGNDEYDVYERIVKSKLMISAQFNTEHDVKFTYLDPNHVYCRSYSTHIAEVSDPGSSNEHELPVGKDRGLLWRMDGYWFFEHKDNGVYVEYESITLSRDVPFLMGKILGPVLHGLPAESLKLSLDKTRSAIEATIGAGARSAD